MSLYSRFLRRVGDRRWFAAVASRLAPRLDRSVYRLTRGRRMATPPSVPTFLLTTTGRHSGLPRTVAVSYLADGPDFIVVGSNWGKAATPEWASNLVVNPKAEIDVGGKRAAIEAQLVPDAKRAEWWESFGAMWPAYTTYRDRASNREILMFRLCAQ